jgi:hypothetical protein
MAAAAVPIDAPATPPANISIGVCPAIGLSGCPPDAALPAVVFFMT